MSKGLTDLDRRVREVLLEDEKRKEYLLAEYSPVSGKDAPGERTVMEIRDFFIRKQWVPVEMMRNALVDAVARAGSIRAYIATLAPEDRPSFHDVEMELVRVRHKYDFPFWAYDCIHIRSKLAGVVRFKLNRAQIIVLGELERMRKAGIPIDLILLKARQWGGSTLCIFYQMWIAFKWDNYHSFAVAAHVQSASETIVQMIKDAILQYPAWDLGLPEDASLHIGNLGDAGKAFIIKDDHDRRVLPMEIYIGSAEKPDTIRSKAVRGAHYSEVGVWPDTPEKRPTDLIADISGGIPKQAFSMQVMESTAKKSDDYFHEVYLAAKGGDSNYQPVFIPWYLISFDTLSFKGGGREEFARWLVEHREDENPTGKTRSAGKHYWWLWKLGATLEGINWYIVKQKDFTTYSQMANEAPSTDIEAFQAAGQHVFDPYQVNALAEKCRRPVHEGELISDAREGEEVLNGITFVPKQGGVLKIWEKPDDTPVKNRYLVVVDIGGPNPTSDYSSVRVIDRLMMMPEYDGVPGVVAEMHYHTDHDLLAYDAVRLAEWYGHALLVIESNTLETNDKERDTGGDGSQYILDLVSGFYDNLYARDSDAENIEPGAPRKWGFHTNTKTKPQIIDNMKKCLRDMLWDEPSALCCDEMSMYIEIDHSKMSAPPKKHDDVLMATAIGLWICYMKMDLPEFIEEVKATKRNVSTNATSII